MKDKLIKEIDKLFNNIPLDDNMLLIRNKILKYLEDNIQHVAVNYFKVKESEDKN